MNYYDRYAHGHHQEVWDELMSIGVRVREETIYLNALSVVNETISRAMHNIESIISKLQESGYLFAYPESVFVPADQEDMAYLHESEERAGTIPMSLRCWFEMIKEVDLTGTHPLWQVRGSKVNFMKEDKVLVSQYQRASVLERPVVDTKALSITNQYLVFYGERYNDGIDDKVGISIMEDDVLSYGSIRGSSEIICPSSTADGFFREPKLNIAPTFIEYLRRSFEWGGFPGFANLSEELRPIEMLNYLREGLLPI